MAGVGTLNGGTPPGEQLKRSSRRAIFSSQPLTTIKTLMGAVRAQIESAITALHFPVGRGAQ